MAQIPADERHLEGISIDQDDAGVSMRILCGEDSVDVHETEACVSTVTVYRLLKKTRCNVVHITTSLVHAHCEALDGFYSVTAEPVTIDRRRKLLRIPFLHNL